MMNSQSPTQALAGHFAQRRAPQAPGGAQPLPQQGAAPMPQAPAPMGAAPPQAAGGSPFNGLFSKLQAMRGGGAPAPQGQPMGSFPGGPPQMAQMPPAGAGMPAWMQSAMPPQPTDPQALMNWQMKMKESLGAPAAPGAGMPIFGGGGAPAGGAASPQIMQLIASLRGGQ